MEGNTEVRPTNSSSHLETRSAVSNTTSSSRKTSASMEAARARAKAEAAKACTTLVQRETEVILEKARLEAELRTLQHEKQVAAANAEAEVLEIAAAELELDERRSDIVALPHEPAEKRTSDYVDCISATHNSQLSPYQAQPLNSLPSREVPQTFVAEQADVQSRPPLHHNLAQIRAHQPHSSPPVKPMHQPRNTEHTDMQPHLRPPYQPAHGQTHGHSIAHRPPSPPIKREMHPPGNTDHAGMSDIARYLVRRELVNSGLSKFDDHPENYWAWKSSFASAIEGLRLTASEELDLLVKWLGPKSSEHVRRLRAVHITDPTTGLRMAWIRLEDCYGCPEIIEKALFDKLESFPKINIKEPLRLRELGDLLKEIESAKLEGYLPGLSYLDTARGVAPIANKLPYNLQEKWMSLGSRYKTDHQVVFPPFSYFADFVCREAHTRNDPSFTFGLCAGNAAKSDYTGKRQGQPKSLVSANKTEISHTRTADTADIASSKLDIDKHCPIHKKPHPLKRCRGFRAKSIEERKTFLKENNVCFRCCSSSTHLAKDCKVTVQCSECNSNAHTTALHPGPPPWTAKPPSAEHGGEAEENASPAVNSKCTDVCGDSLSSRSCSKICLIEVYHKSKPDQAVKVYAILDDQSNRSLARSEFFDIFRLKSTESPYTLRTCAGVTEMSGRRAAGFIAQSHDGTCKVSLPTLIECNHMPDDRSEIPTPEAAKHHSHLSSVAHLIPPLNPDAQILLLLGRDVLQVHKVRDQRNGSKNAPYAQRLDLGWVVVGDVCLGAAHKPTTVNSYRTHILSNGRPSYFSPCPNRILVKETMNADNMSKLSLSPQSAPDTHFSPRWSPCCDSSEDSSIFERTSDDDKVAPSIEDRLFMQIMDKEMFMDDTNSWVAPLPFRSPRARLPNNKEQALCRLTSLCRTLDKKPQMKEHFVAFMQKIFDHHHAELAPPLHEKEECWYLPTFGVYHPRKPEQIRVVFDSSARHHGMSLNDVLLTGPDLNNSLLGVLLRFRREPVAITADIEQMFHSFIVREDHRNYLRFLWFRDNDTSKDIVEYRMRVHVFGNSPSPAVAMYGLRRAALHGEAEFGADAKSFVQRDFYVDDGLKSLPSVTEAIDLLKATQDMLAISNLRLHKIASNSPAVMQAFPSTDYAKDLKDLDLEIDSPPVQHSLGLSWNLQNDTFTFRVASSDKPFTRRGVLATVNSLFDPLGLVAPITIRGKLLLRELTSTTVDWDAPLPPEKEAEWNAWRDSLQDLTRFETPRAYTVASLSNAVKKEIHVFADASVEAIAAVAYLKVTDSDDTCHVGFIMGKAKLAPLSNHTVPRLELCAAVLAVELAELIVQELDCKPDVLEFYTDSNVVLGYISNETRRFYVYVSNRVQKIRRFTHSEQWHYVPTSLNPADVATRSVPAAHLPETIWLTGPAFLQHSDSSHATEEAPFDLVLPESDVEVRAYVTTCTKASTTLGSHRFERFSSWKSLIRGIASLMHIVQSFKKKETCKGWHRCVGSHTADLLAQARDIVIGCVQREAYQAEFECLDKGKEIPRNSPLRKLSPVLVNGLLRIGGRLEHATLDTTEKHPLIIPGRSHVATLLTIHFHERVKHQGRVFTEASIRSEGFWIVGAKRCVNSALRRCVICKKLRGRSAEQRMADLPSDRLSTEPPFTNVGLDVFGPWDVSTRRTRGGQANSKRWAVMFTCLSVRAVHIELIESMDSSSFINALRRFISLRGPLKRIRSDCGTNFRGACKELKMLMDNTTEPSVSRFLSEEGCTWTFNPPHSSHMGGAWERMIGISRRILDSMLSQVTPSCLTHEVLSTFMAEVCAIINARPLTPISTDPESPFLLTPAMILTQKTSTPQPPPVSFEKTDLYRQQWKRVQHLANTFWERWRREYLATLQTRSKWQECRPNIKEGDLVLLKDSQVTRNEWPMALVTKAIPGTDGKVRKLELRVTKGGSVKTFLRPIVEVIPLMSA